MVRVRTEPGRLQLCVAPGTDATSSFFLVPSVSVGTHSRDRLGPKSRPKINGQQEYLSPRDRDRRNEVLRTSHMKSTGDDQHPEPGRLQLGVAPWVDATREVWC